VTLKGSWDWDNPKKMVQNKEGTYVRALYLPPGAYEFGFDVNRDSTVAPAWEIDPKQDKHDKNNVRIVKCPEYWKRVVDLAYRVQSLENKMTEQGKDLINRIATLEKKMAENVATLEKKMTETEMKSNTNTQNQEKIMERMKQAEETVNRVSAQVVELDQKFDLPQLPSPHKKTMHVFFSKSTKFTNFVEELGKQSNLSSHSFVYITNVPKNQHKESIFLFVVESGLKWHQKDLSNQEKNTIAAAKDLYAAVVICILRLDTGGSGNHYDSFNESPVIEMSYYAEGSKYIISNKNSNVLDSIQTLQSVINTLNT